MSKTAREVIAGYEFVRSCGGDDGDYNKDFELWDDDADAIIAALDAAGFVIVPKMPTKEMCEAAVNVGDEEGHGSVSEMRAEIVYEQMIEAAVKS